MLGLGKRRRGTYERIMNVGVRGMMVRGKEGEREGKIEREMNRDRASERDRKRERKRGQDRDR